MTFSLQLEEEDFLKAGRLHGRRWLLRFALPYFAVLFALMVWFSRNFGEHRVWFLAGFSVFLVLVLGFKWFVQMPRRTRKNFRQQAEVQKEMTCSLEEEHFSMEHANGSLRKPWSEFRKWRHSEDLILLYPTDLVYFVIPRRCLTDDEWNKVMTWLERKLDR